MRAFLILAMPKKRRVKAAPAAKQAVWAGPGTVEGSDGAVSYEALTIDGEMFQVNSFVFLQVGSGSYTGTSYAQPIARVAHVHRGYTHSLYTFYRPLLLR